jgi:hypothetical protein
MHARRLAGHQYHTSLRSTVYGDFEPVAPWMGQGDVKHEHRPGLQLGHARRGFPELDGAFAPQVLSPVFVDEPNGDLMIPDFSPGAAHPKDQMGPWVYRWECRYPYVLEHAQHRKFPVLVDQGIVREYGEVDMHEPRREVGLRDTGPPGRNRCIVAGERCRSVVRD